MRAKLVIPAPAQLLTTNAERRLHHMQRARIVKAWRGSAKVWAQVAKTPRFQSAEIVVMVEQAKGRLADPGAHAPVLKACVDGLVDAKVLLDDTGEYVTGIKYLAVKRGPDQITLGLAGAERGPDPPVVLDEYRRVPRRPDRTPASQLSAREEGYGPLYRVWCEVLTIDAIHESLEKRLRRMETLVEEITAAAGDAATCEATFKAEFAKARLSARVNAAGRKITTDEAEDQATVATENERRSYLFASNNLTVLREALRACQSQVDGFRTMAASYRQAGG